MFAALRLPRVLLVRQTPNLSQFPVGGSVAVRFNPARMSTAYEIVVCAGIVPDPLPTLEPAASAFSSFSF
ncbi:MAG: hypothetical protein MUF81_03520 [Verrucomicrobia bacterium]|nr:hypothetical protein [Verrucomicrobiota bacterium]